MAVSDLVHNERTKLLANALDRASTASLAVGVLGPLAAAGYGGRATGMDFSLPFAWLFTILWLCTAGWLHLVARWVLRRMK